MLFNYWILQKNGKRTTRTVDNIGNYEKISKLAKLKNIDVYTWLNNYLENYKKTHNIPTQTEKSYCYRIK